MRILKERIKKRLLVKWLEYMAAAYLLASWGVNGVLNPFHYIHSITMQRHVLEIQSDAERFCIELPQDLGTEASFLSFEVTDAQRYAFALPLTGSTSDGEAGPYSVDVWKGWNTFDLARLQDQSVWNKITIPKIPPESGEIMLDTVILSKYRKMDTKKMLYIFVSFLFLAAFWESVWWIKERYAQSSDHH